MRKKLIFIIFILVVTFLITPNKSYAMQCIGSKHSTYHGVYGVWETSDFPYLKSIGINWIMYPLYNSDPIEGLKVLNAAADNNIKVVFNTLYQKGGFGGSTFDPTDAYNKFNHLFNYQIPVNNKYAPNKALKYHPAIAGNYAYTMNHQVMDDWRIGNRLNYLVTAQRKEIYQKNKEITMRDDGTWVPMFVHYRSAIQMEGYDNINGDGIKRGFEAGEADIALLHDYPNYETHEKDSDPSTDTAEEMQIFFERERNYIKSRDPNVKINMLLGAMGAEYMPSPSTMERWACLVSQSGGADTISWWPWRHGMFSSQLGSKSGSSYIYQNQHCALYSISASIIPGWLKVNAPNSPSFCPSIPIPSFSPMPTATSLVVRGDANGDGRVDGLDYVIWVDNYGTSSGASVSQGDFNRDGKVDGLDYVIWVDNYNT